MATIPPEAEYVHNDYPRDEERAWKENWYFNFIDREHNAWGINHISLERHKQTGRFSAFHVVDGEILMYLFSRPPAAANGKTPASRKKTGVPIGLVAGAGFEPATSRL